MQPHNQALLLGALHESRCIWLHCYVVMHVLQLVAGLRAVQPAMLPATCVSSSPGMHVVGSFRNSTLFTMNDSYSINSYINGTSPAAVKTRRLVFRLFVWGQSCTAAGFLPAGCLV